MIKHIKLSCSYFNRQAQAIELSVKIMLLETGSSRLISRIFYVCINFKLATFILKSKKWNIETK